LSTEPRPIKVANTAPGETTRANEIAIETAKTGKVTAVVAVMSIFSKKKCKSQNANCGNEKPSCQKSESANSPEENSRRLRILSQKIRKGQNLRNVRNVTMTQVTVPTANRELGMETQDLV
jgi:hypothetical protein